MLRIYGCIVEQHDLRLVVLAALICLFTCFTAVDLFVRARDSVRTRRLAWLSVASTVFGSGVWATHFVAELAYNPGFPLGYDIGLTALSAVIAMSVAWLGMLVALWGEAPMLGGAVVGAAVGAMHYVGMAALRVPAELRWDARYVLASLAIGVLLSAPAIRILCQASASAWPRRLGGALLLVAAICGLHFTGMAAVVIVPNPLVEVSGQVAAPQLLAIAIAAVTAVIIALGLSGSIVDHRLARQNAREAERLRKSEAQLRRSQQHLARAQRVAGMGSIELNLKTGEAECTDETFRLLGVDPATFVATAENLLQLVHEKDRARVRAAIIASREGVRPLPLEYRIVRPDGEIRILGREAELTLNDADEPTQLFVTIKDVTELRAAEEKQRDLERQLLHAHKLEALGTLAGGIAHDLNNTLVPVIGLAKLTMKRLPEHSRERANLAVILKAGERGRDLVRQILAFSRKDAPTRQTVDLALLVRDSLKMLRASLPATIQIVETIETAPLVSADPTQLHQIVVNLIVNAAQAIGEKMGTITVALKCETQTLREIASHQGEIAHLSVQDTGCGMDEATVQRIFEPFFTTKPVGVGTGLGLSVVDGIVAQHGGCITVQSGQGTGTCFHVYLPALSGEETKQRLETGAAAA